MTFNKENAEKIIRQLRKEKVNIPAEPLAKSLAFLINNGYIENAMDIAWSDFDSILFFTNSKGQQDMLLIDSIENDYVKIAILDYWINHQELVMPTNRPYFVDMYNDLKQRPIVWTQTKDALVKKEDYDIRRVIEGQPNSEERIRILEEKVAHLERKKNFKYIPVERLKPEKIAEVETHLSNACASNAPDTARSLCRWQAEGSMESIENVPATEIFDALATRFKLNFKLNAFQKAWKNRHNSKKIKTK